jgi:hypothetical protein
MHYHQNHCWCANSNWSDESYDARYMVSFGTHISYQHKNDKYDEDFTDWDKLVYEKDNVFLQDEYDHWKEIAKDNPDEGYTEAFITRVATKSGIPCLKPVVIEWLNENVADCPKNKEQPQGWAMGNDSYRSKGSVDITIWFYRRRDAMKFIKVWSVYEKPTTYLNYFKDDYRELYEGKLRVFDRCAQDFVPKIASYDPSKVSADDDSIELSVK